jgi:predicted nucleic acid-binding protein
VDAVRLRLAGLREIGLESAAAMPRRLDEALAIADRHRLSVYDALYVQIARETDASVATLDRAMRRAAEAEGVEIEALD